MTLKDQVQICAPSSQVWSWMEDPRRMMQWNPKLIEIHPISRGPIGPGYQYKASFSLNGRNKIEFSAEIVEYEVSRKWVCRYDQPIGEKVPRDCVTIETLTLVENEKGTQVHQRVEIRNSGIPILLQFFMMYIQSFGTAVGRTHLAALKKLAEDSIPNNKF